MTVEALVSRLEGMKRTGPGRWVAKCPAHEDKRPSLSIRELDDGRILAHCFAGCAVDDVLAAIGLDFEALFPERLGEFKRGRSPESLLTVSGRRYQRALTPA